MGVAATLPELSEWTLSLLLALAPLVLNRGRIIPTFKSSQTENFSFLSNCNIVVL